MYYYKLIILILFLFLLIFINISFGRKCKCSKDERVSRRYKRGFGYSCFEGGERKGYNSDEERKRKGKGLMIEENEEEEISNSEDEEIEYSERFSENYGELSNYGEIEEINSLKSVLIICNDFYYSPLNFYKLIANILSEKYQVDMLVYTKKAVKPSIRMSNLQIIYIPITTYFKNLIRDNNDFEYNRFLNSEDFYLSRIYKEIFEDNHQLADDLLEKEYSFGIADFNEMAGPFVVFEALGIKNTFNVSSSVFLPKYLQFLINNEGNPIDVTDFNIPG